MTRSHLSVLKTDLAWETHFPAVFGKITRSQLCGYYTSQRMRQQPNKISKTLNPLLQSMEPFGHVHIPNICGVSIVVVI